MTDKEAIEILQEEHRYCQEPCYVMNAIERAITALREKLEREQNEPLTLEQLRHGRWEECDYVEPCIHGFGTIRHKAAGLKCTNCVHVFEKNLLWKDNYCPNCGARMDLEVNDG